jgi:Tfp pilus assembly protein PilF
MKHRVMKVWLVVVLFGAMTGCAVIAPVPKVSQNTAVLALVENAHADAEAGRLPNAAATLERALRIESKNPRLWQELARVRMQQGDYAQAESTAARANTWVGDDHELRAQNWRLIAEARAARGDDAGAKAAQQRAEQAQR